MPFRPLGPVIARWRPWDGEGGQQVIVTPYDGGLRAEGIIIGGAAVDAYGVRFALTCDAGWRTLTLDLQTASDRELHLRSEGDGVWRDARGVRLPRLDGCIDVDLAGSPFTNTLPIRRLGLTPANGARKIKALYVPFDTFAPIVDRQIYRCLAAEARYRYQAADSDFLAEFTVDDDGLVVDYPPLFRRVPL
jgi:hypothetical protein